MSVHDAKVFSEATFHRTSVHHLQQPNLRELLKLWSVRPNLKRIVVDYKQHLRWRLRSFLYIGGDENVEELGVENRIFVARDGVHMCGVCVLCACACACVGVCTYMDAETK